jgi:hypothetical protein
MCKEMPVIPVNKVVDPKRIIGKMEGQGGGEAQGVACQKENILGLSLVAAWLNSPYHSSGSRVRVLLDKTDLRSTGSTF